MAVLVLDTETYGQISLKRLCNQFDSNNGLFLVGIKTVGLDNFKCAVDKAGLHKQDFSILCPKFNDYSMIVGQNLKFDLLWFWHNEELKNFISSGGVVWDTMTVEHILNSFYINHEDSSTKKDLDTLSERYGGVQKNDNVKEFFKSGKDIRDYPDLEELKAYNRLDVENTEIVYLAQLKKSQELGILPLIKTYMEHYLAVCEMEYNGLTIDIVEAEGKRRELLSKIKEIENNLVSYLQPRFPEEVVFNPASPSHISKILFGGQLSYSRYEPIYNENGLPEMIKSKQSVNYGKQKQKKVSKIHIIEGLVKSHRLDKNSRGDYSTDDEILKKLLLETSKNDTLCVILSLILEHRFFNKLLGTYFYKEEEGKRKGLLSLINPETNVINPDFKTASTRTGRLACGSPNIQNLPKDIYPYLKSRYKEGTLLSVDFAQLEICIAAYLSNDPLLIQEIKNGVDLYKLNASMLYNCSVSAVTPEQRKTIKILTLALLYGMHYSRMAVDNNMDEHEAKKFVEKFYAKYAGIKDWHDSLENMLNRNARPIARKLQIKHKLSGGYVTKDGEFGRYSTLKSPIGQSWRLDQNATLTKRGEVFRYWPPTDSKNYSVQGTATTVVNLAVGALYRILTKHPNRAIIINEIHDEIWVDTTKTNLEWTIEQINNTLGQVPELWRKRFRGEFAVPIRIEIGQGLTIQEAKTK